MMTMGRKNRLFGAGFLAANHAWTMDAAIMSMARIGRPMAINSDKSMGG
jgi:hypothetical protein